MQDGNNINQLMNLLRDQYIAGNISLNALVHRLEALLERAELTPSPEKHRQAMNCIYVIEEINALVLDEGRAIHAHERLRVTAELEKLSSLIADE